MSVLCRQFSILLLLSSCAYGYKMGVKRVINKKLKSRFTAVIEKEPPLINCSQAICTGPLSNIYCGGKLIQLTWMFGMQASCPGDMMRHPPETILREIDGYLLACYTADLVDWVEKPDNVLKLKDPNLRNFTSKLNLYWKTLAKELVEQVHETPNRFPILAVKNPFIVPGGDFEIYFYWDSYWINKGLLFSNMTETVRLTLENFATILNHHGFIPNSGNIQLSQRSQPPLLTQMVADYYSATGNKTFLKQIMPYLEQELSWWRSNRTTDVELQSGRCYKMFRYKASSNCPRPENYISDVNIGLNGTGGPEFIWSSLASACESGLDFTSRWFSYRGEEAETKRSIRTIDIVPVDLNVFMAWNYATIAGFSDILQMPNKAAKYRKYATEQRDSINALLWNEEEGSWFDYDLIEKEQRRKFYISNVFPLLLGNTDIGICDKVLRYLVSSGALNFEGGVPVSLSNKSHEQWDFPNGWPPFIHLFVESMRSSRHAKLIKIGEKIAFKFITSVYNGLMNPAIGMPSACWEKYDVRFDDGRPGSGGEYAVQQGFGWTNGAVLDLIYKFYILQNNDI